MTLNAGGTFDTEWNCSVPKGNFLARRGMDFASDNKKATSYGNIQLDYAASYKASSEGNSRLCVYGWFAENTSPVSGPVVEYYIIEDWVNWCPQPDGQSQTVTIDGADYEVFRIKHYGPTIRSGGGSEEFWQYFSIRKSKRTSGIITVSEHFKAWEKAGFEIYNLYEVALNAEGWESSGSANVSRLEMTVGGDPIETTPPEPTEPPTEPADGIYMKEGFESGAGGWKFESGKEPYLIMITAGGNDTVVYDTPKPYHENLEKNGVPHIWHYYQQGYHGDNSIHAHLYNFCRFVFQN